MDIIDDLGLFLSRYQGVSGGLQDPGGKEVDHSYGNAFFALFCAQQYQKTKKKEWLSRSVKAVEFELETATRYRTYRGIYRWEFKNYALLQTYQLLHDDLPADVEKKIQKRLLRMKNICSFQTNYMMMRVLNSRMRYGLFGSKKDLVRSALELQIVLSRQDKDGFFWDAVDSNSFQYHCYVLALLFQYCQSNQDPVVKKAFLRGVQCMLPFVDQRGDCVYLGRGQKQIFGYASFIYALYGAASLTDNRYYADVAKRVWDFILPTLREKEIVVGAEKGVGWYAYNTQADYLTFAAVYLSMAFDIKKAKYGSDTVVFDFAKPFDKFYSGLNIALVREKKFLLCFGIAAGTSAEKPTVYHSYPAFFPTSGGTPGMDNDIFVGVKKNGLPTWKMFSNNDSIILRARYDGCVVEYSFQFGKDVGVITTVHSLQRVELTPLHFLSKEKVQTSIPVSRKKSVSTLDGQYDLYEASPVVVDHEMSWWLRFGNLSEKHHFPSFRSRVVQWQRMLWWSWLKPFFFGVVLLSKFMFDNADFRQMLRYRKMRERYY